MLATVVGKISLLQAKVTIHINIKKNDFQFDYILCVVHHFFTIIIQ